MLIASNSFPSPLSLSLITIFAKNVNEQSEYFLGKRSVVAQGSFSLGSHYAPLKYFVAYREEDDGKCGTLKELDLYFRV